MVLITIYFFGVTLYFTSLFNNSRSLRSTFVVKRWSFYIPNLTFISELDLILDCDIDECLCYYELSWFQQLLILCKIFAYHRKHCTNLFVFLYIFLNINRPFYSEYIYMRCASYIVYSLNKYLWRCCLCWRYCLGRVHDGFKFRQFAKFYI